MAPALWEKQAGDKDITFDPKEMVKEKLPESFYWPSEYLIEAKEELQSPLVDLEGFLKGDEVGTARAVELIREACSTFGLFQIINHGVDPALLHDTQVGILPFFNLNLPMSRKLALHKTVDDFCGYSGAHAGRFAAMLPWKEMLTFEHHFDDETHSEVADYFKNKMGDDFAHTGLIYQKFCEAMKHLSEQLFKLLAISLGLQDTSYLQKFYEDGLAIFRCNYYPVCPDAGMTFGTGPHCDPTSMTILHQDQIGGLEVFTNDKWYYVKPHPGALVINIGDTFMALTNGVYKSCLHRAAAKSEQNRISFAYFINPKEDKVVSPIKELVDREGAKKYSDFKWKDFRNFTQRSNRADATTIHRFMEILIDSTETK